MSDQTSVKSLCHTNEKNCRKCTTNACNIFQRDELTSGCNLTIKNHILILILTCFFTQIKQCISSFL